MSGWVGKLCLKILYDLKIELMQGMFSFIILLNFSGPNSRISCLFSGVSEKCLFDNFYPNFH